MEEIRWEYSLLARSGNRLWVWFIDRPLRWFADDQLEMLRRLRGFIQLLVFLALALLPLSIFYSPAHLITASGLLFDVAGALRLFLLEEVTKVMAVAERNAAGNFPSVYMREFIMPEAGPYDAQSPGLSYFYYEKRGVLFLVVGFVLQFIGDLFG